MLFFLLELFLLTYAYCAFIILSAIKYKHLCLLLFDFLKFEFNVHLTKVFIQFVYIVLVKLGILILVFEFIFFSRRIALAI